MIIFMLLLCSTIHAVAQDPVLRIDFEDPREIKTITGISGRALDLGNVPDKYAFEVNKPLKNEDDFTITLCVKGDLNAPVQMNQMKKS